VNLIAYILGESSFEELLNAMVGDCRLVST